MYWQLQKQNRFIIYLFIYFEIQHATIQQQNYKIHNTAYAYMDTKGRVSRHLHSTIGIWQPEAGLNKHTHIHKHEILGLGIKQK